MNFVKTFESLTVEGKVVVEFDELGPPGTGPDLAIAIEDLEANLEEAKNAIAFELFREYFGIELDDAGERLVLEELRDKRKRRSKLLDRIIEANGMDKRFLSKIRDVARKYTKTIDVEFKGATDASEKFALRYVAALLSAGNSAIRDENRKAVLKAIAFSRDEFDKSAEAFLWNDLFDAIRDALDKFVNDTNRRIEDASGQR